MHLHPQRLLRLYSILLLPGLLLAGHGTAGVRWGNGLPTQPIVFNALTTNPHNSRWLVYTPLSTASVAQQPWFRLALVDPAARIVMRYLVSCALPAGQQVAWQHPMTGQDYSWKGEMGLCPRWGRGQPDQQCLERVSSCVLARNNPQQMRVRISLRGVIDSTTAPALLPQSVAWPDTYTDPASPVAPGTLIDSFKDCPAASTRRNCGWSPVAIAQCLPNQRVDVWASNTSSWPQAGLRACSGVRGCDSGAPDFLTESPQGTPGPLLLSLVCPGSGRFSLQAGSGSVHPSMLMLSGGSAFVPESDLFPVREAAFYGLIFGNHTIVPGLSVHVNPADYSVRMSWQGVPYIKRYSPRDPPPPGVDEVEEVDEVDGVWYREVNGQPEGEPSIPRIHGSVYPRMFVCSAPGWSSTWTYQAKRLCAVPGQNVSCASTLMGNCRGPSGRPLNTFNLCQSEDSAGVVGDKDFQGCLGYSPNDGYKLWSNPLTTFLQRPDALVP